MNIVRAFVLVVSILAMAGRGWAQCEWRVGPQQAEPGLHANVFAQTQWDPDGAAGPLGVRLVAAGLWPNSVGNIAIFDGSTWEPLGGAGVGGGQVNALAVYNGQLIVAGSFTTAGGQPANRIASWNGTTWSPLGAGLNGTANALAVYNGELYAGGEFTTAGGGTARKIARWNGSSWNPLGTGITGLNNIVYAMAVFNGSLYVGGTLSAAGLVGMNNLAFWNSGAGTWTSHGSPNGTVYALAVRSGGINPETALLYVGGSFTTIGGVSALNIARYGIDHTTSWSALGSGLPRACRGLFVHQSISDVVAVLGLNNFLPDRVWRWTGTTWNTMGAIEELTASANSVVLYGGRYHIGSSGQNVSVGIRGAVRAWDGTELVPVGPGLTGKVSALAVLGPDLIFGGEFKYASGQRVNYIARWDGSVFHPMDSGMSAPVRALRVFEGQLYAAGEFTVAGTVVTNNVARWNGTTWEPFGLLSPAVKALALAEFNGELLVGGRFDGTQMVRRRIGSVWQPMSTGLFPPGVSEAVQTLGVHNGTLYAGFNTSFLMVGGDDSAGARWDASTNSWININPDPTAPSWHRVYAYLARGSTVLCGGEDLAHLTVPQQQYLPLATVGFSMSRNTQISYDISNSQVRVLAEYQGQAYAAGAFNRVNGQTASGFARLEGSTWVPLHPGTSQVETGVSVVYQGELVLGGDMQTAGGLPSSRWARWFCPAVCYANCDESTTAPVLNVGDFTCFLQKYALGDAYANCDQSTAAPTLNVADFTCFLQKYALGCP